ncbi:phosphosulfolactate synthase [Candidatus Thioglobus autotrophicus]|uniref:phosphosulfolactate synthase n=1 Tax=Candidatus Thioglobus autotrophicus TaxID=1705394 RepID=UPI00299F5245|nr:phosphosulfolactate synthase [Candidatus Thioglobus autotrophicus]WPE17740.1 phosphosulfolactate synthase [Candidatus Thioglobus autotrophicus]
MIDFSESFIDLPKRCNKPRASGMTYVMDYGLSKRQLEDVVDVSGQYIDMIKFGWGTGLVVQGLNNKIEYLNKNGIDYYFGGTMFELAYLHNKLDDFCIWLEERNVNFIEVSDGSLSLDLDIKLKLIERLSKKFKVIIEIGSKDNEFVLPPSKWISEIKGYLSAGVYKVMAEGRESGQAGIYRQSGEIRMGLIEEILSADISSSDLIFEAPNKDQQLWFIKNVGMEVNLGNIRPDDVINLETLRLGLRSEAINIK